MSIKTRYNEYKEYIEKLKLAAYSPVWWNGEHLDKESENDWLELTQVALSHLSQADYPTEAASAISDFLLLAMYFFVSAPIKLATLYYMEANAFWLDEDDFIKGLEIITLESARELLDELRKKDAYTISNTISKAGISSTDRHALRDAISTNNLSAFETICSKNPVFYDQMLAAFGLFKYHSLTAKELEVYSQEEHAFLFDSLMSNLYQLEIDEVRLRTIMSLQDSAMKIRAEGGDSTGTEIQKCRNSILYSDSIIRLLETTEAKHTLLPEEQQIFSEILSHPIRRHVRVVDGNVEVSLTPFTENVDNSVKEEKFILPEDFFDNDKYIVTGSDDYYFHVDEHNIIGDNKSGFKAFRHNTNAIQNFVDGLAARNYIDNSLESKRLMVFKLTGRKLGNFDETQPVKWEGPHMIPFSMSRTFFKFKGKFEKVGDLFDFKDCVDFDARVIRDSNGHYTDGNMSNHIEKAVKKAPEYTDLIRRVFHTKAI